MLMLQFSLLYTPWVTFSCGSCNIVRKKTGRENGICRQSLSVLAVAGLVLTSCGIYTKYQRPEDITTDGLYEHDLDGQSLDSLSLFAASDTVSIASLSWLELFTDTQL